MGLSEDFTITVPTGKAKQIKASMVVNKELRAPIVKGQKYGVVKITLDDKEIASVPLVALTDDPLGGIWTRLCDRVAMQFNKWFNKS